MADDTAYEFISNPKGKSIVWGHFSLKRKRDTSDIVENVAYCNRCKTAVKCGGGTTNLKTHLERHHKIFNLSKSGSKTFSSESSISTSTSTPDQPKVFAIFQQKQRYKPNSERSKIVTEKIARFMVKDLRPFSVVSNEGFCDLVNTLDPNYIIPSKTYFSQTVIPEMYERVKADVLESLSGSHTVALTTDGWTSRATESYITITSCHITEDWSLKSFVLQTRAMPVSHTAENVSSVIKEAIKEWGLPANTPLVTDNAANMLAAAKLLGCEPHIGCYAHTLNLAVQKGLQVNAVSRLLGRIRRVVGYFHRSTTAAAVLRDKIKLLNLRQVKLIQDVCTRWNSAVDMIERFLELQPAVYTALMSKDIRTKESDVATLNEDDITLAEKIMAVLVPLRTVSTALCSASMPTASLILPLQKKLLQTLTASTDDSHTIKQMKVQISADLSPRYSKLEQYLQLTTILDPCFKTTCFADEDAFFVTNQLITEAADPHMIRIKTEPGPSNVAEMGQTEPEPPLPQLELEEVTSQQDSQACESVMSTDKPHSSGLASLLEDVIVVKSVKGTKTKMDQAKQEMDVYLHMDNLHVESDPLVWWKEHEWKFPLLANLARKYLCVPATSVPSERVFSTAGDIVSAQRATLDSDKVDMLIFLKKNMA